MKYFDPFTDGGFYHIFNHAVGSENLFRNRENYRYFLEKYHEYIDHVAQTYCYCLMPNHFHFLVRFHPQQKESGHKNLMQPISNLLNSYTKSYNNMFKRRGALFINRTRRRAVTDDIYLHTLVEYIHTNPVRDGFCESADDWRYSSFRNFASNSSFPGQQEPEGYQPFCPATVSWPSVSGFGSST